MSTLTTGEVCLFYSFGSSTIITIIFTLVVHLKIIYHMKEYMVSNSKSQSIISETDIIKILICFSEEKNLCIQKHFK